MRCPTFTDRDGAPTSVVRRHFPPLGENCATSEAAMSSQPDFNALVLQMRAARTTESMMVLYKHLFQIDEWYFPSDPKAPLEPMQWRFPEGVNTTPCILGYTDAALAWRRATEVAGAVGGTAGVMTLSVIDAVRWMISGKAAASGCTTGTPQAIASIT